MWGHDAQTGTATSWADGPEGSTRSGDAAGVRVGRNHNLVRKTHRFCGKCFLPLVLPVLGHGTVRLSRVAGTWALD